MCGGRGRLPCSACGGSGGPTVSNTITNDAGACPSCNGSGKYREECDVCFGKGKIKVEQ
jgi:DnaJ-class molecular chaperone